MAKRYFLQFLVRDLAEDLVFEVREKESNRLQHYLGSGTARLDETRFFWFSSIDGKSVAINLTYVQAIRYLWDVSQLPMDATRNGGPICIWLRGCSRPLEENTESPDQLYDFFVDLEFGADCVPYPLWEDIDGELLQFNPKEIVWVTAPQHLVDEGARIVAERDGIADDAS